MSVAINLFSSLLNDSLERMDIDLSVPTQGYLAQLLLAYMRSDCLFEQNLSSGKKSITTLAELYLQSRTSAQCSNTLIKKIADQSLYLGGFFRDFLKSRQISLSYYLELGQSSYKHLTISHPLSEVFEELSDHFIELTDVMSYISYKSRIKTHQDLVNAYRKYLITNSKAIACQLEDHNVFIPKLENSKFI